MYPGSVTYQGQISIPVKLRRLYGLDKNKNVLIYAEDDGIKIKSVPDFLSLAGSFKTNKKPLTNKQLENVVAKAMAQDVIK
ncbi:MAG: AbrB/MazE/SpoVT family DNA-binding domain-containing protein [Patescibacteria group bacterium]